MQWDNASAESEEKRLFKEYWNSSSFQRRYKKLIKGREHNFLALQSRDFIDLALMELRDLSLEGATVSRGGIRFSAKLHDLYRVNLKSTLISRFFLVLPSFRVKSREELFRKVVRIPWELYLNPLLPLKINSRVRNSILQHQGLAGRTLAEGIKKRFSLIPFPEGIGEKLTGKLFSENPPGDKEPGSPVLQQRIDLYLEDNSCEIRIDSSGAHLHRRGYRARGNLAPLRETLAASLLKWVLHLYGRPGIFLDPMGGSGTFSLEFASLVYGYSLSGSRDFTFCHWPGFQAQRWEYFLRENRKAWEEVKINPEEVFIFYGDIRSKAVLQAERNAGIAGVARAIGFTRADFFKAKPKDYGIPEGGSGLLVLNPPYGRRLYQESTHKERTEFYRRILTRFYQVYPGWRLLLLLPKEVAVKTFCPDGVRPVCEKFFIHGGIPITGYIFR